MPSSNPRVLAIVGPTCSGKSALALSVAGKRDAEIVSADSRQIYKFLDIGTAKPTREERERVRHHFVDLLSPTVEYNAGQFGEDARKVIAEIIERERLPVLVGGSGLYVKAALDGLFHGPGKDPEIRLALEAQLRSEGLDALVNLLKTVDPVIVQKMREITPRRVIRALEVYRITGKPISQVQSEEDVVPNIDALWFGLLWDRKELYHRIEKRVDEMIAVGLVDEMRSLILKGFDHHLNALNTVGYKEAMEHLDGNLTQEEMITLIKRNTRRFAKRQMTWFNRDSRIRWLRVSGDAWLVKATHQVVDALSRRPGHRR